MKYGITNRLQEMDEAILRRHIQERGSEPRIVSGGPEWAELEDRLWARPDVLYASAFPEGNIVALQGSLGRPFYENEKGRYIVFAVWDSAASE